MNNTYVQTSRAMHSSHRFEEQLQGTEGEVTLAAFNTIAEVGLHRATTRAIASRGGLHPALVNYYFRSKEKLLVRMLDVVNSAFSKNIEEVADSEIPPAEKLALMMDEPRVGADSKVFRVNFAFWAESMVSTGEVPRISAEMLARWRTAVERVFAEGERSGSFAGPLEGIVGHVTVALITGLSMQAAIDPDCLGDEELDRIVTWFMASLGGSAGEMGTDPIQEEHAQ